MKKRLLFVIVPAVLIFVLLAAYLYQFTVTEEQELYLTPMVSDDRGWELYVMENGEKRLITAGEAMNSDVTVYMERVIPADWKTEGYTRARLSPTRRYAVFADGSPIYTNCPGIEFTLPLTFPQGDTVDYSVTPSLDISTLPVGAVLTVASAPVIAEGTGTPMFVLTSDAAIEAVASAYVGQNLVPITVYGVLGLLLFLLFAYGLTQGQNNFGLLLLSLAAVMQMLDTHALFGTDAGLRWYLPLFRQAFWLLPMLYCGLWMEQHKKLFLAMLLSCWGISAGAQTLFALSVPLPWWIDSYAANLLYLPFVSLLVFGFMERKSQFFRLLMPGLYGICGGLTVLFFISLPVCAAHPTDNTLLHEINYVVGLAADGFPHEMFTLIFTLLLFLLLLILAELQIRASVKQAEEAKLLAMKNDLAIESIRNMERSAEELAVARHDERSHLKVLAELSRTEPERAADYAESLLRDLAKIPSLSYTENTLVNTILRVQAGKAGEKDIAFYAEAILPAHIGVPDKDLCAVLMNLLDNALQAAEKAKTDKKVEVQLSVEDDYLLILIANSLPDGFDHDIFRKTLERSAKPGQDDHGFGIRSVKAVVKNYGGELRYTVKEDMLTVQTAMMQK